MSVKGQLGKLGILVEKEHKAIWNSIAMLHAVSRGVSFLLTSFFVHLWEEVRLFILFCMLCGFNIHAFALNLEQHSHVAHIDVTVSRRVSFLLTSFFVHLWGEVRLFILFCMLCDFNIHTFALDLYWIGEWSSNFCCCDFGRCIYGICTCVSEVCFYHFTFSTSVHCIWCVCVCVCVQSFGSCTLLSPDITYAVDWALLNSYLHHLTGSACHLY